LYVVLGDLWQSKVVVFIVRSESEIAPQAQLVQLMFQPFHCVVCG